jgi:hypothetical protein
MKALKRRIKNFNVNLLIKGYIILYGMILVLCCSLKGPLAWGEFDDYTLPVASILNDHNFSITEDDVRYYKSLFPELSKEIDTYSLSGYTAKNGKGQLTWYFPTYALLSIPFVLLLKLLGAPASYGFMYTNIALMLVLLFMVYKCLDDSPIKKFILVLILSLNPILFYVPWLMAEAAIFAFLGMAMLSWYKHWDKRAAAFLSIAGTINPTVMATGFFMIFDYLIRVIQKRDKKDKFTVFLKKSSKDIIQYGGCYSIALIPMVYNYYNIGHINLTASYPSFTQSSVSVWQRFRSYFIDLNYGYILYYGALIAAALILLTGALKKKHWHYVMQIAAFLMNVYLYSIMVHIDCGGSGIARYSSWCAVIFVFAVILYYDEILKKAKWKRILQTLFGIHIVAISIIVITFGPYAASNTWGKGLGPVEKYVLDHFPSLYNPLKSSFVSHINNTLGMYDYETPIVYTDDNGYVRKILACSKDAGTLSRKYTMLKGDNQWFKKQLDGLTDTESYISVPLKYQLIKNQSYYEGFTIDFTSANYNAENYVVSGIYGSENWGAWSSDKMIMAMSFANVITEKIYGHIQCGVYNNSQHVKIYVNDELAFDQTVTGNNGIEFNFANPKGPCQIVIELPDAKEKAAEDGRCIGLSIGQISFNG